MENKKVFEFNTLYGLRYSLTQVHNAPVTWSVGVHSNMDVSYKTLIDAHGSRLGLGQTRTKNDQVLRNQSSTLHAFLTFHGKTTADIVGRELRGTFDEHVAKFLATLVQKPKTLSDKRSHLRAWKLSLDAIVEGQNSSNIHSQKSNGFTLALRQAVGQTGLAPKTLARQCKISTSAMQRWIAGAKPNERTLPALRRLEQAVGLARGTLERFLNNPCAAAQVEMQIPSQIPYRQYLKVRIADTYRLKESQFTEALLSEWRDFVSYKTATYTPLARRSDAVWRLLPLSAIHSKISLLAQVDGLGCSSAQAVLSRLCSYWGYLRRDASQDGHGIPETVAQTIAALVVPEWLQGFMQFCKRRSNGKTHEGHAVFASIIAGLVNPEFGYLWQLPSHLQRLPADATRGRSWEQLCRESHALARAWKRAATDVSRDPVLPIQALLNQEEPLAPIIRAISALDQAAAEALPGSMQQAIYKRDALLLSVALENPLRVRTLSLITYNGDSGTLYLRGSEWRLRFTGDDFKNDSGSRRDDYDASISGLNERIEEFIWDYRPALISRVSGCLLMFPNPRSADGKHSGLGRLIHKITKRYIPESPGFGPHAIRHLVASAYLKKHPKDFLTVAELLHDDLGTVMKRYAHLSKDDSLKRYSGHVAEVRSRCAVGG